MAKIYKYFSHQVADLVFERDEFVGVKCSLPKEYNDPYELFLSVDFNDSAEYLATYSEIIQELPQLPTTCFSKSPIVTPMWAHYGQDQSGFVLEFETDQLQRQFEGIPIRDVEYRESPNPALAELLVKAAVARKPRHAVWLQQAVLTEAYFSKHTVWSYEQECRLVTDFDTVEDCSGNHILFIPQACITSIIVGNRCPDDKISYLEEMAENSGVNFFQVKIGKSYPVPYFSRGTDETFIFDRSELVPSEFTCGSCSEPILKEGYLCPWCNISEDDKYDAAMGNPFRILDSHGLLDEYMQMVRSIEGKNKDLS